MMRKSSPKHTRVNATWNPKLEATSKAYQPKILPSMDKTEGLQRLTRETSAVVEEVMVMAEARHEILLGHSALPKTLNQSGH